MPYNAPATAPSISASSKTIDGDLPPSSSVTRLSVCAAVAATILPVAVDLKNPNFAKMAQAIGIAGIRVEDPADLKAAISELLASKGPALLEVLTNPFEVSMPPKIDFEEAYGFTVFMLKAVVSGHGNELIKLGETNIFR